MSHATAKNWGSVILLILTVVLVAAEAPAQLEKVLPPPGVLFQVGHADGAFIANTTTDSTRQEAVLPCSFAVFGDPPPANVNTIQLKLDYDDEALEYVGWSADNFGNIDPDDVYWGVAPDVIPDPETPGLLIISLTGDTQPASTEFQEFVYLKFKPLCKEELTATPVKILFGFSESFIFSDIMYSDPGDPENPDDMARYGSVTVADYTGFLALNDFDPYDEEPSTIVLQGVVGQYTEIEVPIILSANANVTDMTAGLVFDETKLAPVRYELGGLCHDWIWTWGMEPSMVDTILPIMVSAETDVSTDDEIACRVVNVIFEVLGDWRGQSTDIRVVDIAWPPLFQFGEPGNSCSAVNPVFDIFELTVVMEAYEATVTTVIDDMIYPGDEDTKDFFATVQIKNNFHIGGISGAGDKDSAPIRIDLDLAPAMVLLDVTQPDFTNLDPANPLDDFYFNAGTDGQKSLEWDIELYSVFQEELPNQRPPTPEFTDLVEFELGLRELAKPATFDDFRIDFGYLCEMEDRPAHVVDAVTDSLEVACWTGLFFEGTPYIDYAVGELVCETRTSTKPYSVTQEYWARTSFELTDFEVRVNKSGTHAIVSIDPAPGVKIEASGTDYVTFADDGTNWTPGIHTTRRLLGTITYSLYPAIPVFEGVSPPDQNEKSIGPGITWCWRWTNIAFDPDSFLHGANNQDPYMYIAEGNVGTRWDCSIIVNPDPLPMPKGEESLPAVFDLVGNFPNPFNPQTVIRFDVPRTAHVTLEVMDVQGRRIATLIDGVQSAGRHEVQWSGLDLTGRRVASGVYFSIMKSEDFIKKSKMVLLK